MPAEGVIQFNIDHRKSPPGYTKEAALIDSYRSVFMKIKLIGQSPELYDGFGYGNISVRVSSSSFLITASQTGDKDTLFPDAFSLVNKWDYKGDSFKIESKGLLKPSSESITHAVFYDFSPEINAVIHVHSKHLFHWGLKNKLPATDPDAGCGSRKLANTIAEQLHNSENISQGILIISGHEDGVVCYADSLPAAAELLYKTYQKSKYK